MLNASSVIVINGWRFSKLHIKLMFYYCGECCSCGFYCHYYGWAQDEGTAQCRCAHHTDCCTTHLMTSLHYLTRALNFVLLNVRLVFQISILQNLLEKKISHPHQRGMFYRQSLNFCCEPKEPYYHIIPFNVGLSHGKTFVETFFIAILISTRHYDYDFLLHKKLQT